MKNAEEVLTKILTLLNYSVAEITQIITDLGKLITNETVEKLISNLPQEKKDQMKNLLLDQQSSDKSHKNIPQILAQNYSQPEINKQMNIVAQDVIKDYVQDIIQEATDDQKKQIIGFISSLTTTIK